MKKITAFFTGIFIVVIQNFSQGTAYDWILADCNSNNYTLFDYLDSQEVVVMEFSMACGSCTNAAGYLMSLKNQYAISQPGKVNWFYMDYWAGHTCATDVAPVMATYNFDAYFAGCSAQETQYFPTLSPMPGIVIAAGNYHTIIYQNYTWYNSDTVQIKQAIDQFFNTVGIESNLVNNDKILVYPNPVEDVLYVEFTGIDLADLKINIFDISGKKVEHVSPIMNKNTISVSIPHLVKGQYILEITSTTTTVRKLFIKN